MSHSIHMPLQAARRGARRFGRSEDGFVAPQLLFFFMIMLLVGGVAVDLMRFETRRVAVQNTMDRATLAAASLEQTLDPVDVVNDYFDKAGLEDELDSIDVDEGMNYKIVSAEATVRSNNFFMSMMDVPYLEAVNTSQAEQRVTNVEIALVLDVSGSMHNTPSRIQNLRTAAKDFVDTVLENDNENKISIAIVPYNGQVNLGPTLITRFNRGNPHAQPNPQPNGQPGRSYCLDLPTSTYANTTLSTSTVYQQSPFVDTWSGTSQSTGYVAIQGPSYDTSRQLFSNVWCNPVAGNYVRLHNNNASTLRTQIDGLVAIGATSIDLGMKWGAFFLDPSSRSITASMTGGGGVPSYFSNRPADYDDEETMKVIVLMTDGENFTQERMSDSYRNQLSPIWRSNGDGMLSIFHDRPSTTSDFWVPHRSSGAGEWRTAAWNSGAGVTQLTWNQVWFYARTDWVAWQLYARPLCSNSTCRTNTYNTWEGNFRTFVDTTTMNSRLDQVCEAAKDQGVIVYGIAFEAPPGGEDAIRDCASSPSSTYYFDVAGLEIATAFALIASNLSQLRLTQ